MKKLALLIIIALMLVMAASCQNSSDTQEFIYLDLSFEEAHNLYVGGVNAVSSSDSFAGNIILYGFFFMPGIGAERENDVFINVKHIFGEGDNYMAAISAPWTARGLESWYKDGTFFFRDDAEYFSVPMQGHIFKQMTLSMLVTEVLFHADGIFHLDSARDENGTVLRFEVSSNGMEDVLRQLASFEDMGGFHIHPEEDVSYDFEDVVVRMRVNNDGVLEDIRFAFIYQMVHHHISDDLEVHAYLEVGMYLTQVGGVTIDFPEDMQNWPNLEDWFLSN